LNALALLLAEAYVHPLLPDHVLAPGLGDPVNEVVVNVTIWVKDPWFVEVRQEGIAR